MSTSSKIKNEDRGIEIVNESLYRVIVIAMGDSEAADKELKTVWSSMVHDPRAVTGSGLPDHLIRRYYKIARKKTDKDPNVHPELGGLSSGDALLFYLKHVEGLSIEEMAMILRMPVRRIIEEFDAAKARAGEPEKEEMERLFSELPTPKETGDAHGVPPTNKGVLWRKGLVVGMVLGAFLLGMLLFQNIQGRSERESTPLSEELPRISFSLESCGIGYQGIRLPEGEELVRNNPWKGETMEHLPVFMNLFHTLGRDPDFQALDQFFSDDRKVERAQELAAHLGWDITHRTGNIFIADGHGTIFLNVDLSAYVEFHEAVPFPEVEEEGLALQEAYLGYFMEMYGILTGFLEPEMEVTYSYDETGKQVYEHFVYEGAGSLVERMTQYSMQSARYEMEEGLHGIHLPVPLDFEVMALYPVLSAEEALERFENGDYVTPLSVQEPLPREAIHRLDLLYFYNYHTPTLQPLYVAYVAEGAPDASGHVTYSLYYVPALRSPYVEILDEDA